MTPMDSGGTKPLVAPLSMTPMDNYKPLVAPLSVSRKNCPSPFHRDNSAGGCSNEQIDVRAAAHAPFSNVASGQDVDSDVRVGYLRPTDPVVGGETEMYEKGCGIACFWWTRMGGCQARAM